MIEIIQDEDGDICSDECSFLIKGDMSMKHSTPRCRFSKRETDSDGHGMWWLDVPGKDCPGVGKYILDKEDGST